MGFVLIFIYLYCFYRAYLRGYFIIYTLLKKVYTPNKQNSNIITNLPLVLVGSFLLTVRYIIGLPLQVIRDSFDWSIQFRNLWSKDALTYESDQKLSEVYSIFIQLSTITYGSMVNLERCVIYKSSKLGTKLYFNPRLILNSAVCVPLGSTSILEITSHHIKHFKQYTQFQSFKAKKNDWCFGWYHSGGTVDLGNGHIMVNFLTSQPKYNLPAHIRYLHNDR